MVTRLVAAVIFITPALAWACPYCARQNAAGQLAYYLATALMLLLPLLMISSLVMWLRRLTRRQAELSPPDAAPEGTGAMRTP